MEKNGTQCFKSGSQRQLDNKFDLDESNVIINTDQKGSCLSSRQRISETRMKPISRRSRPCGLDNLKRMYEIPCVLFYDELSRRDNKGNSNREQVKRTQMIVKRNVSEQMVLTVRISCSGTWAESSMIVGPMHEEMSFKIDVSRDQESRSRSSRRSARSRRLKSHSDHCAWLKISNDGVSGVELIDVRIMVIFGGCPDGETRTEAIIDIPTSHGEAR